MPTAPTSASPRAPRAPARRPAPKSATRRTAGARAATQARAAAPRLPRAARLPGWGELDGGTPAPARPARRTLLDAVPSARFVLLVLLACAAVTLYVGHVYGTQATLAEAQTLSRENLRLHLKRERLRGAYDRMTGPANVMERAAALGLEEGVAYGPAIRLDV